MDLHNRNNRTLENGNECKRTVPNRGKRKRKKKYLPRRFIIPIIICHSNDIIELYIMEMQSKIQIYKVARKSKLPNVCG